MFRTVGIIARIDRKRALEYAAKLVSHLEKRNLRLHLEPTLAKYIGKLGIARDLREMKVDLVITVGGDGTILRTCLDLPKPEPPILAINMGVRGFLTSVNPDNGLHAIDRCLEGEFSVERITKISVQVGSERLPDALNEVYITSKTPAKLLYAEIKKNGMEVGKCRADGFVIASKAGATGYSLSAGGPILDPSLEAFVLTPVCPLTLFYPVVFTNETALSIRLIKPKKAVIVIDGYHISEVGEKDCIITISGSENKTRFIRFEKDFYMRLRRRLLISRGRRS